MKWIENLVSLKLDVRLIISFLTDRDAASVIEQNQISRYVDDIDMEPKVRQNDSRPAPHWLDGPRDSTTLPDIIASTYSDYNEEA